MLQNLALLNSLAQSDEDVCALSMYGDLKKVKAALKANPKKATEIDECGWPALFFAASNNRLPLVQFLLSKGANPYFVDDNHENIVEVAKDEGCHTETSRYLKKTIGFPKHRLATFTQQCTTFLRDQLNFAKKQNKKLLVILGETHGEYKIFQLEKCFLKAINSLGIDTLYSEQGVDDELFTPIDLFAKHKLKMDVFGVDNLPTADTANIAQRNSWIKSDIEHYDKEGVLMIGSDHLFGLLESEDEKINTEQFHIVPFNLSPCAFDHGDGFDSEAVYAFTCDRIIQIVDSYFPVNPSVDEFVKIADSLTTLKLQT